MGYGLGVALLVIGLILALAVEFDVAGLDIHVFPEAFHWASRSRSSQARFSSLGANRPSTTPMIATMAPT